MNKSLFISFLIFGLCQTISFAQTESSYWMKLTPQKSLDQELRIKASQFDLYHLDKKALRQQLAACVTRPNLKSKDQYITIAIPVPGNKLQRFGVFETPVMEEELQNKYPEIRTYTGQAIDDPRTLIKLDLGPAGFHAMIYSGKETFLVEPAYEGDLNQYMVFDKNRDFKNIEDEPFICHVSDEPIKSLGVDPDSQISFDPTGEQLRTYRLALACTGEYSIFHGGTKPLVLSAMVTAMNRVNGVYERDLTITMVLINNTDTLIYFDPVNDPYTNNNGSAMLDENVTVIESIIGSNNYDIGHVFSTGGGGIAGLGVVCGNNKAYGVTGQANPIGDPFSIDYVAHEIGHQFGGSHTFNSCGGQGSQPYEPGSGVTIMAYAGICNNTNLQPNSIDQFHVASFDEMITYSQNANGNTCAVITETGNTPPIVDAGEGGFFIPFQTPFELTGTASDIDGDSLTYCWEQFDLGPNTHPDIPVGNAPLFRSWQPVDHATRVFPRLQDLKSNRQTIGELLPQFGRDMNFRLTVRDNAPEGGGVDYDQLTFQVADNAGPFLVDSPNGGNNWQVGYLEPVTWDVANTDQMPVNCQQVDIYLSEDGGDTYPHLIAEDVDNDGFEIIQVPDITGNRMRIKIKGSDNVFFDISNQNFSIDPSVAPDFVFAPTSDVQSICDNEIASYDIRIDTILGYSETIVLSIEDNPVGTEIQFSDNNIIGPSMVNINVVRNGMAVAGDYVMTLKVQSDTIAKELPLNLIIRDGIPAATQLTFPDDGLIDFQPFSSLRWDAIPFTDSYVIQIANSPDFANPLLSINDLSQTFYIPDPALEDNTIYYWRVKGVDQYCGDGQWSDIHSFQTKLSSCQDYVVEGLPINIPSPGSLPVPIQVNQDFIVHDVNIKNIQIDHRRSGQILMRLHHHSGESAKLLEGICGNQDDFNLGFDDDGIEGPIPCPATDGLTYQPLDSLSRFNGLNSEGIWILEVQDSVSPSRGELLALSIQLCGPTPSTELPELALQSAIVYFGDSLTINSDYINGICGNNAIEAEYILTSLPNEGQLKLDGEVLAVGSVFSQTGINKGLLKYFHNGENLDLDGFDFILNCAGGVYQGQLHLELEIELETSTDDPVISEVKIYPNPADEYIEVRLNNFANGNIGIALLDLMGKEIINKQSDTNRTLIQTKDLTSGFYFCRISRNGKTIAKEKILIIR